jgi:hypothetical protein
MPLAGWKALLVRQAQVGLQVEPVGQPLALRRPAALARVFLLVCASVLALGLQVEVQVLLPPVFVLSVALF